MGETTETIVSELLRIVQKSHVNGVVLNLTKDFRNKKIVLEPSKSIEENLLN